MIKVLVDVDAMYGGKITLSLPSCSIASCDRTDGNHRDDAGFCHRSKWCPHARRIPEILEIYQDPNHFKGKRPYEAVPLALKKMQRCDWELAFWTTRPKSQMVEIVNALKRAGVWDEALLLTKHDKLLHILDLPIDFNYSVETAKLTILESAFGQDLVDPEVTIIAIEADPLEAAILKNYQPKVLVTMAPQAWLNIIAVDPSEILNVLTDEQKRLPRGTRA